MSIRYLLLLVLLGLPSVATAQFFEEQLEPELLIDAPGDLAVAINNFTFDFAPPYVAGDTLLDPHAIVNIGASFFISHVPGPDSVTQVPAGFVYTPAGVTAPAVLVQEGDGRACEPLQADLTGAIAVIQRGTCFFVQKLLNAQTAGALGVVVYNQPELAGDRASHMGGDPLALIGFEGAFSIPIVLLPLRLAEPVVDALAAETPMTMTIRAYVAPGGRMTTLSGQEMVASSNETAGPAAAARVAVYPNPFVTAARFDLTLSRTERVRVTVYDLLGRAVAQMQDGPLPAGTTSWTLDGAGLASGTYVVRIVGEGFAETRRVTRLN